MTFTTVLKLETTVQYENGWKLIMPQDAHASKSLIEALAMIQKDHPNASMKIITSSLPDEDGAKPIFKVQLFDEQKNNAFRPVYEQVAKYINDNQPHRY